MSSRVVRDAIFSAVEAAAAPWDTFDLSEYNSFDDVLSSDIDNAVLVQYVVSDDTVQSIGGEGNQGWEETGTVVIHLVTATGFASGPTVDMGDAIRLAMRGRRLGDVLVESFEPFVDFGQGGGVSDGAWHRWAANIFYTRRTCG